MSIFMMKKIALGAATTFPLAHGVKLTLFQKSMVPPRVAAAAAAGSPKTPGGGGAAATRRPLRAPAPPPLPPPAEKAPSPRSAAGRASLPKASEREDARTRSPSAQAGTFAREGGGDPNTLRSRSPGGRNRLMTYPDAEAGPKKRFGAPPPIDPSVPGSPRAGDGQWFVDRGGVPKLRSSCPDVRRSEHGQPFSPAGISSPTHRVLDVVGFGQPPPPGGEVLRPILIGKTAGIPKCLRDSWDADPTPTQAPPKPFRCTKEPPTQQQIQESVFAPHPSFIDGGAAFIPAAYSMPAGMIGRPDHHSMQPTPTGPDFQFRGSQFMIPRSFMDELFRKAQDAGKRAGGNKGFDSSAAWDAAEHSLGIEKKTWGRVATNIVYFPPEACIAHQIRAPDAKTPGANEFFLEKRKFWFSGGMVGRSLLPEVDGFSIPEAVISQLPSSKVEIMPVPWDLRPRDQMERKVRRPQGTGTGL